MRKAYPMFGITAPLFYILVVIIDGYPVQGYSHLYNSISELTVSNAPKIPVIYILFFIYNILVVLFGAGLYHDLKITCNSKARIASLMLITVGLMGVAMLYYVQDPRTDTISFNGMMHIILTAISSVLSMAIIILLGLSFRSDPIAFPLCFALVPNKIAIMTLCCRQLLDIILKNSYDGFLNLDPTKTSFDISELILRIIKYALQGGTVEVLVKSSHDVTGIAVKYNGKGIPSEGLLTALLYSPCPVKG